MMIQYIKFISNLSINLFSILFFCYLYNPLYKKCNIIKKIKKNGKTKIISQPKTVLAISYLILLYALFKFYTIRIILFIGLIIIIFSLFLLDKFTSKINNYLFKINKNCIFILSWKILHTFFTLIYIILDPLFLLINNYIYKKFLIIKNIFTKITNFNLSDDNSIDYEKEILKISEEISNMSDYIYKTNKNDPEIKNITKSNIKQDDEKKSSNSLKHDIVQKIDKINRIYCSTNSNISDIDDMEFTEIPN